jgi:hypothetical protein
MEFVDPTAFNGRYKWQLLRLGVHGAGNYTISRVSSGENRPEAEQCV